MDQIPEAGKLFVGGLRALDVPDRLEKASITHILSVLEFDYCDWEEFGKYKRLLVQVEDHPQENLLQRFEQAYTFIEEALRDNGVVIVHCAMGVSRSATVVCAYLMKKLGLDPKSALEMVQRHRPLCAPNEGFQEQLKVYHRILKAPSDEERGDIYYAWLNSSIGASKM
jgi:dual specificity phosphatase 12